MTSVKPRFYVKSKVGYDEIENHFEPSLVWRHGSGDGTVRRYLVRYLGDEATTSVEASKIYYSYGGEMHPLGNSYPPTLTETV